MTKFQLERKYGLHSAYDPYYSIIKEKMVNSYAVYTADGSKWGNFKNTKAIRKECKMHGTTFLEIKNRRK